MLLFSQHILLGLALLGSTLAQSIGFTVYPQQVVTGLIYTVAWNSNSQPATIELLRDGRREDVLFTSDGTTNTFRWSVQDDYSGDTNYALQISSGSTTISTSNIDVIEDEDGLVVSGSTITAPSATSTVDLAAATALSTFVSATTTASITDSSSQTTVSTITSGTSSSASVTSSASASPSNTSHNNVTGGLSGGVIAGIVVGLIGAAAVGAAGVWLCLRRRRTASGKPHDEDIGSFLALSRNGRASGTIKGTSPEVSEVSDLPRDTHELNAGGIVGSPELYGELFAPWNERNQRRFYSDVRPVEEVIRKPIRYELPADSL